MAMRLRTYQSILLLLRDRCANANRSSCVYFLTSSVEGTPAGGFRHDVGFFVGFSPPFDTRCRFDLRPSDARGLPARPPPGDSGDVSGDKPTSASNRVGFFTTAPFFRPASSLLSSSSSGPNGSTIGRIDFTMARVSSKPDLLAYMQ
eukprot:CAMPEP_0178991648 /NCGR_PEP_ID=MMETSP0795-20121207/5652_1 /TAXON_ID=88552 /ORGANISM="Amoebophrya sp., Strain Ameob2" /LENGTH=146 /DNA_ID=CAMNT_0020683395 /DNA_START=401 /DNA_END=841 /DNA_ORIENTATION=+